MKQRVEQLSNVRLDILDADDRTDRQVAQMRTFIRRGVDAILVETQNTIREAGAATRAASRSGLPVLTSFVCGGDGKLLSGETITAAVESVLSLISD